MANSYPLSGWEKEKITSLRDVGEPLLRSVGMEALKNENGTGVKEHDRSDRATILLESGSDHPLVQVFDQHRAKYVRDQKWMPENHVTDFDAYDTTDFWTRSIIDTLRDEDGDDVIVSSLRLTRIEHMSDCMSLKMAGVDSLDQLSTVSRTQLSLAAEQGQLYDLTRLTPPSKKVVTSQEYFDSVVKIIGHGVYHTAIAPNDDPLWLFATTSGMQSKLSALGMPNEKITSVQRPGEKRTVLCLVHPLEALHYLATNRENHARTFSSIIQGIDEARLSHSV